MKKITALLLAAVMLVMLLAGSAYADGESYTVSTRTGRYTFAVGDTLTFKYWIELTPELINAVAGTSVVSSGALSLKKIVGNIDYDTDCLRLVNASMPKLKYGKTLQKTDIASGTPLDGTVIDFSDGTLAFYAVIVPTSEKDSFGSAGVVVSCTFKVLKANSDSYLRSTLRSFVVETASGTEIALVDKGDAKYVPYVSFETVNDETPSIIVKSQTADVGLDVRFLAADGSILDGIRPNNGAVVVMYGATDDGRYIKLKKAYTGDHVVTFYSVPYGMYYAECYCTDADGNYYATPDPEKAEVINVPNTGETQALWLVKTEQGKVSAVNIRMNWVGDNGYVPARPRYVTATLKDGSGADYAVRSISRTETVETISYVDRYDSDGNEVSYSLNVSDSGNGNYIYDVVAEDNGDFSVTATFTGDPAILGAPSQDGHYWKQYSSKAATCTADGYIIYICEDCNSMKTVTLPASHSWGSETVVKPATCTEAGTKTHTCTICGATESEEIPALGHDWGGWVVTTPPTAESDGIETCACSRCNATQTRTLTPDRVTVFFNANGGSVGTANKKVLKGGTLGSLPTPMLEGFAFDGWYSRQSGGTKITTATVFNTDTTVYAHWNEIVETHYDCKISVASVKARPGDTVTIPIVLDENPGIAGLKLTLEYDRNVLTLRSLTGKGFETGMWNVNAAVITWANTKDSTYTGTIAEAVFEVNTAAADGLSPVTISYEVGDITNAAFDDVMLESTAGGVTVSSRIPGDVNGDEKVNIKDVVLLMKLTSGETLDFVPGSRDINGDGKENIKDVVLLMKYISGEAVTIY